MREPPHPPASFRGTPASPSRTRCAWSPAAPLGLLGSHETHAKGVAGSTLTTARVELLLRDYCRIQSASSPAVPQAVTQSQDQANQTAACVGSNLSTLAFALALALASARTVPLAVTLAATRASAGTSSRAGASALASTVTAPHAAVGAALSPIGRAADQRTAPFAKGGAEAANHNMPARRALRPTLFSLESDPAPTTYAPPEPVDAPARASAPLDDDTIMLVARFVAGDIRASRGLLARVCRPWRRASSSVGFVRMCDEEIVVRARAAAESRVSIVSGSRLQLPDITRRPFDAPQPPSSLRQAAPRDRHDARNRGRAGAALPPRRDAPARPDVRRGARDLNN